VPVFVEIPSWETIWKWVQDGVCGGLVPDLLLKQNRDEAKKISVVIEKVFPYEAKLLFAQNKAHEPIRRALVADLGKLKK
jgi:hypothetical protein